MLEARAAVEADAGEAEHGEFHRQRVALFAVRIVPRRAVDRADMAVREGRRVKMRSGFCLAFKPEAEGVLVHRNIPRLRIRIE